MDIIFFGAGKNAQKYYLFLKGLSASNALVCACDNNESLHNKELTFADGFSVRIVSFEEALQKYPNAIFWVTPQGKVKGEIILQLINAGVDKEQIKFFTPYEDVVSRPINFRHYQKENKDGTITAFIPLELCFTADIEDFPYHKNNNDYKHIYNAPIMKKTTLLNMYRMFMNGRAYQENMVLSEYKRRLSSVKFSGINFDYLESIEKFSEHEYWHFHIMNEYLAEGNLDFFIQIAPYAKWNKKQSAFNMSDGTHRAMLFYLHGYRHIPLRVSKADYFQFLNMEELGNVNKAFEICMTEELDELPPHAIPVGHFSLKYIYTPILHPAYYDIFVSRESYYQSRLDLLNEFFAYMSFEGKTMVDIGANLAYIPQNFARQGAICTCIEYVKQRANLAEALTGLYGLKNCVKIHNVSLFDFEPNCTFQIGIILAIFDHWSTKINSEGLEFLKKVDSLVEDMLIWESGNKPEIEKRLIMKNTKFKEYTFISFTFGTGKCRELGIFTRVGYHLPENKEV